MFKESKEDRIRRRSESYAKGEIDLETFVFLEEFDQDEEEDVEEKESLSLLELDEKRRAEKESQKDNEVQIVSFVDNTPKKDDSPETLRSVLKSITREEFVSLPLEDMQRLHDFDPEKCEQIMKGKPSIFEMINSEKKPSFSPDLTVEEFRKMSIKDLNDLFHTDPDLYNRLCEESLSGGSNNE